MQLQVPIVLSTNSDFDWIELFTNYASKLEYKIGSSTNIIKNLDETSKKLIQFGDPVTNLFIQMDSTFDSHKELIQELEKNLSFHILGQMAQSGFHLIMFDKEGNLQMISQVVSTNWKPVFIEIFTSNGKATGNIPEFLEDAHGIDLNIFK